MSGVLGNGGGNGGPGGWAVRWRPNPQAACRLFCVPHSGGGAAVYRSWAEALAPQVEVVAIRLPGRETRFREPAYSSVADVVPPLVAAVQPLLDRPAAWFGHSMGALIAYEACRALDPALVARLVVAARPAPHLADDGPPLHDAPAERLLEGVRALNGTPGQVQGDTAALRTFLPTLRADFAVVETYTHGPGPILSCPISAFGGATDAVATERQLAGWEQYTTAGCTVTTFPGGHFFVHEHAAPVLAALRAELSRVRQA